MRDKSAAFTLPCIPLESPQALQPDGITLPLFPHQLRSLYLMKLMEDRCQLDNIIPGKNYKTKGGIIADEVGMGKTALVIGLVLANKRLRPEEKDGSLGGTLVVTPEHLCHQWQSEVRKFSKLRCMIFNNVNQLTAEVLSLFFSFLFFLLREREREKRERRKIHTHRMRLHYMKMTWWWPLWTLSRVSISATNTKDPGYGGEWCSMSVMRPLSSASALTPSLGSRPTRETCGWSPALPFHMETQACMPCTAC